MAARNPYYDPSLPHHTPTGFQNLDPAARIGGDLRRWRLERKQQGLPRPPAAGYAAFAREWTQRPDFTAQGVGAQAWWIGHACVLLRLGGLHLLTDPVFSRRCSPVQFAGPERKVESVARIDELPPIDVVLISHNHYDHLDAGSVRALAARAPQTLFLAPLGVADKLRAFGATQVRELDWWQATEHRGLQFHCVPAQHWSARTLWDRNRSLWCGWVARHADTRFYFAGDTGYWPQAHEIADRCGAPDLAALPIGAYAPRWFMQGQHIDPAQAVRLHCELRAKRSLAIHWGSFELADDLLDEPPQLLRAALADAGLGEHDFWLLRQGESRGF